jgi:hypothetical protein
MGLSIFSSLDTFLIFRPLQDGQIKIAVSTLVTGTLTILLCMIDDPDVEVKTSYRNLCDKT